MPEGWCGATSTNTLYVCVCVHANIHTSRTANQAAASRVGTHASRCMITFGRSTCAPRPHYHHLTPHQARTVNKYKHTHAYARTHTYTRVHTHIHTQKSHVHTRAHTYTHVYTHMYMYITEGGQHEAHSRHVGTTEAYARTSKLQAPQSTPLGQFSWKYYHHTGQPSRFSRENPGKSTILPGSRRFQANSRKSHIFCLIQVAPENSNVPVFSNMCTVCTRTSNCAQHFEPTVHFKTIDAYLGKNRYASIYTT